MSPAAPLRLALRDWDWLTPLRLGEVPGAEDVSVAIVDDLPEGLVLDSAFDAVEMSLAQAAQRVDRGDRSVVALPCFPMRGFRHRCGLVRGDSEIRDFTKLQNRIIGMTGWQDTGSVWIRGILAEAGVTPDTASFRIGKVNAADPAPSALPLGVAASVAAIGPDENLLDLLLEGRIDALFAPFPPAALYRQCPSIRTLLPDVVAVEAEWARRAGFVPGLHVIGLRRETLEARPDLARRIPALLDGARAAWQARRRRYVETTPWLSEALAKAARLLPDGWDASGLGPNRKMTSEFLGLLHMQGLIRRKLTPSDLFPACSEQP